MNTTHHCDLHVFSAALADDVHSTAGGHAAHFANVNQYSPFFSQERAPTSVSELLQAGKHAYHDRKEPPLTAQQVQHHVGPYMTAVTDT